MMTVEPARTNLDNEKGAETPLSPEELARREAYAEVLHDTAYPLIYRVIAEYVRYDQIAYETNERVHIDRALSLHSYAVKSVARQIADGLVIRERSGSDIIDAADYVNEMAARLRQYGPDPIFDRTVEEEKVDEVLPATLPIHIVEVPVASLSPEKKKEQRTFNKIIRQWFGEKVMGVETILHSGEIETLPPTLQLTTYDRTGAPITK